MSHIALPGFRSPAEFAHPLPWPGPTAPRSRWFSARNGTTVTVVPAPPSSSSPAHPGLGHPAWPHWLPPDSTPRCTSSPIGSGPRRVSPPTCTRVSGPHRQRAHPAVVGRARPTRSLPASRGRQQHARSRAGCRSHPRQVSGWLRSPAMSGEIGFFTVTPLPLFPDKSKTGGS